VDFPYAFLSFTAPLGGTRENFWIKLNPQKTRVMGLSYGENIMILYSTVFVWSTRVTERRTDRQTDRQTDGRQHIAC